jgi:hypothetical protein
MLPESFYLEKREGVWVVVHGGRGCRLASQEEACLWVELESFRHASDKQALAWKHRALKAEARLNQRAASCSCHSGSICGPACSMGKHHDGCPHAPESPRIDDRQGDHA